MKTLVINPPNFPFSEKSLLIEPIDVLTIATYAQSLGSDVRVIDMDVKQMAPASISGILKSFQPELTIIPFDYHIPLHTSKAILGVNQISRLAKNYGSRVVIGGKTPKYFPAAFLDNGADVIINGEIESVSSDLLKLTDWSQKNLSKIRGISYHYDQQVRTTAVRLDKMNLDSLPIPDRSLVDLADYIDVRTIWSSRGCPGKCSFCATPNYWCGWRSRSPENVANELEHLIAEHGAKKILFLDDNATANKSRMQRISQEIIDRGLEATFGCLGTISAYNKGVMAQMYKAGFRWIHYGAESGSQRILDSIHKRITPAQIKRVLNETKNAGLRVRTSWIFDLPGTTELDLRDTINLILNTESDEIRAHYLSLRAGTELCPKPDGAIPSQYIHHSQPDSKLSICSPEQITADVSYLTQELQKKGYLAIRDAAEWRSLAKLKQKNPQMKFISFCPAKYGINWEVHR